MAGTTKSKRSQVDCATRTRQRVKRYAQRTGQRMGAAVDLLLNDILDLVESGKREQPTYKATTTKPKTNE